MLKFAKSVSYLPDPEKSRPFITDTDKEKAAQTPPAIVPFHCKPWVDGQSVGWTLLYGYITPITLEVDNNGELQIHNLEQLAQETQQPKIIDKFTETHFGLSTGYTLQTPPGIVSLILPATHAPVGLIPLTAVIETDWYPHQLFVAFNKPPIGTQINLDYKTPLVRVVLIPRHETLDAQPLDEAELADLHQRRADYIAEEKTTTSRWTSAAGQTLTHLYKQRSAQFRRNQDKE